MRRFLSVLVAIAGLSAAYAQNVSSAPYLSVRERGAYLLSAENVRAELNLTPAEIVLIDRAFDAMRLQQEAVLKQAPIDERRLEMIEHTFTKAIYNILPEKAADRLCELTLQQIGIRALADRDICTRLGISTAHGKQIGELFERWDEKCADVESQLAELIANKMPDDPAKRREAEITRQKIIDSFDLDRKNLQDDKKVLVSMSINVLDLPERDKWKAALGKPFKFWTP